MHRQSVQDQLQEADHLLEQPFDVLQLAHTGVTVIEAVGRKEGGDPTSVNDWDTGVPKTAPAASRSVATTVPAPTATEVVNAQGVGVSIPVKRTAGCGVPLESVTTTLVEANSAPVGVGMAGPLAMATMTEIRVVDMGDS
jgi:hypothetical protein